MYKHIKVPSQGEKIVVNKDMSLNVPDQPIILTSKAMALG